MYYDDRSRPSLRDFLMTLSYDIPQVSSSSTGKQPVIPAPVHTTRQTTRRAAAAAAAAAISNARSSRTHQVQI